MYTKLTATENLQSYDVEVDGVVLSGEITNRTQEGDFRYRTDSLSELLSSSQLNALVEKLEELNDT